MKSMIFQNIKAVFLGFIFVIVFSTATDLLLMQTHMMKQPLDLNPSWFIAFVVFYRSLYSAIGSYITARFAPNQPMRLAMIGGGIGFVLSIVGAVVMWDQPPHWYPISLIITALPSAWIGAKMYLSGK